MPDSAKDEALRRYRIIQPFLQDLVPLAAISRQSALPLRTLRRWVSRYRRQGIGGLTRQPRVDKGTLHSLPPEKKQLIEALALEKPRRSVSAICRTLRALRKNGSGKGPGYTTVFRIVRTIDPGLLSLAHEGGKAYSERFDLLYRRQAASPNAMWQADHTELDINVLDEQGNPARPWLTVIIDDYSPSHRRVFSLAECPLGHVDCPGAPPGDLAQDRTSLAGLRHPGCPLYR